MLAGREIGSLRARRSADFKRVVADPGALQAADARKDLTRLAFWIGSPIHKSGFIYPALAPDGRKALDDLRAEIEKLDAGCTLAGLPSAANKALDRIAGLKNKVSSAGGENENARRKLHAMLDALRSAAQHAASAAGNEVARYRF